MSKEVDDLLDFRGRPTEYAFKCGAIQTFRSPSNGTEVELFHRDRVYNIRRVSPDGSVDIETRSNLNSAWDCFYAHVRRLK